MATNYKLLTVQAAANIGLVRYNPDISTRIIYNNADNDLSLGKYNCKIIDSPSITYEDKRCIRVVDVSTYVKPGYYKFLFRKLDGNPEVLKYVRLESQNPWIKLTDNYGSSNSSKSGYFVPTTDLDVSFGVILDNTETYPNSLGIYISSSTNNVLYLYTALTPTKYDSQNIRIYDGENENLWQAINKSVQIVKFVLDNYNGVLYGSGSSDDPYKIYILIKDLY